ncbi:glycosyl transferase [Herbaspirillum huttiense]|uniref:glycosyl transferase n=1 Tax=Herbaspirillum huttiense TaxID=863372 RepID=UPI0010652901|nr:glycosyl transferase [Herbaspirillum huttiense]QBP73986.1 glycosyl transferase [Herbaspirillum huttiense]
MPNLVYLSPVPLTSFAQRPHKFVEWFGKRHDGKILWVDPYPTRLPQWSDLKRKKEAAVTSPQSLAPQMECLSVRALPLEPLPMLSRLNASGWKPVLSAARKLQQEDDTVLVLGKPSLLALELLGRGGFIRSIYDAMDDFPAFYSGWSQRSMALKEQAVAAKVDEIWASSTELCSKWSQFKRVEFVPNACDQSKLPEPAIRVPKKPVLGYVGTMGPWFDWEMLLLIANARPDLPVHLVGPIFNPASVQLPANIEFFPPCRHEEALAVMNSFAVGLIPFKLNRLTNGVDPIKYYEYRALGLPVISSAFGEMREHRRDPGVFILEPSLPVGSVQSLIGSALEFPASPDKVLGFREKNSWDYRFDFAFNGNSG